MVQHTPEITNMWSEPKLVQPGKKRPARRGDRTAALRTLIGRQPTIYALHLKDGVIKIGHTQNLEQRRTFFTDSKIIGFRFGTLVEEQAIHDDLVGSVHHGREYYYPTAEVIDVVNKMRREWGRCIIRPRTKYWPEPYSPPTNTSE